MERKKEYFSFSQLHVSLRSLGMFVSHASVSLRDAVTHLSLCLLRPRPDFMTSRNNNSSIFFPTVLSLHPPLSAPQLLTDMLGKTLIGGHNGPKIRSGAFTRPKKER